MVKKAANNLLVSKLGSAGAKAVQAHAGDEVKLPGGGDLPPGINFGVAQLVDCKFDVYKKGEMKGKVFFYARGIVVEPTKHEGKKVEGLSTSYMEPVCDTPKSAKKPELDDHISSVMNQLQMLGASTDGVEVNELEDMAEALAQEKPYFGFRTWVGEATTAWPNPKVQHTWTGVQEHEPSEESDDEVIDTTSAEEEEKPQKKSAKKKTPSSKKKAPKKELTDDLDELAELADEDNAEASQKLSEIASNSGISEDDVVNAENWIAVVEMINEASSEPAPETDPDDAVVDYIALGKAADEGDGEAETTLNEAADEAGLDSDSYGSWADLGDALFEAEGKTDSPETQATKPEKGDVWFYKPPRARKYVECDVTAVFDGKETCNLKNLDDGKTYKSVPWDALREED